MRALDRARVLLLTGLAVGAVLVALARMPTRRGSGRRARCVLTAAAVLAFVIAAGLMSPSVGPPAARAAHNPGAPLSGLLWVTTDLDPRLSTFSLTQTDRTTAEITFAQLGASPGAIPYAGCDPGPGTGQVFYVGTYQTAAGDSGTIAGCQESPSSSFSGWYRSSGQTTPDQAWGITLQIGGPSAGPGTYALPGELLPERHLSWQEAPAGTPPPPLPSAPIVPRSGEGCVGAGVVNAARAAQAPPKEFCGSKALRDDVRANIEAAAIGTGGIAFTTCLAWVLASAATGATIPFSGGVTATVAPWVIQTAAGACGTSLLTWGGLRLVTAKDDIVRRRAGAPAYQEERGARAAATPPAAGRVVLPRPRLTRGVGLSRGCRGPSRAGCVRLSGLAGRAVSASATAASLAEAMAVSADRSLRAAAAGDAGAAAAQDAVATAYAGALADALAAQRRAHVALARGMRANGIDMRPGGGRSAGMRRRLARGEVPTVVVSRLRRDGFSAAQIREAFRSLGEVPARPLSLSGAFALRIPTARLAAAPKSIGIPEAAAVVRVLNAQGALSAPLAAALLADLERLRVADGAAREAAADRLAADARRAPGRHGLVLQLVVAPLVGG